MKTPFFDEDALHRRAAEIRVDALEQAVAQITEGLQANSAVTNEIKADTAEMVEMWRAAKGGIKVLGWLGRFAKWFAAIAAAFAAIYAFVQNIRGHQ